MRKLNFKEIKLYPDLQPSSLPSGLSVSLPWLPVPYVWFFVRHWKARPGVVMVQCGFNCFVSFPFWDAPVTQLCMPCMLQLCLFLSSCGRRSFCSPTASFLRWKTLLLPLYDPAVESIAKRDRNPSGIKIFFPENLHMLHVFQCDHGKGNISWY